MSDADNNRRTNIMARTVRTKVYKFDELNDKAKDKAIEWYRNSGMPNDDSSMYYDEAHDSVKAFNNIFGTEEGRHSWLEISTEYIDDNILNLKGLRLQKYIWNNFKAALYKGKYYHNNGKSRHSRAQLDNSCVLTGVCWDNSLLQPVYDFLDNYREKADYYSYMDFKTLITDCFHNLEKDLQAEDEYRNSDEAIIESIEANEYEFTQDGRIF